MDQDVEDAFLFKLILFLAVFIVGSILLGSCGTVRDVYEVGKAAHCGSGPKCGF